MERQHQDNRLSAALDAYQNQWDENGFRCPANNPNCQIKKIGDLVAAFRAVASLISLHHLDDSRFCDTHTTYSDQVEVRCQNCHRGFHKKEGKAKK